VLKERDTGFKVRLPGTIEIELDANLCLKRVAFNAGCSIGHGLMVCLKNAIIRILKVRSTEKRI